MGKSKCRQCTYMSMQVPQGSILRSFYFSDMCCQWSILASFIHRWHDKRLLLFHLHSLSKSFFFCFVLPYSTDLVLPLYSLQNICASSYNEVSVINVSNNSWHMTYWDLWWVNWLLLFACGYFGALVQERRNSIANALELRLICTKPSICKP